MVKATYKLLICMFILTCIIVFFKFLFISITTSLEFPFELTKAKGWRTFVEREHSTHHTVSVWSNKH